MNRNAQMIRNRLSLRPPQLASLEILTTLCESLELKKSVDLAAELEKVKQLYPTCTDFERDFPSLCFALATGVGKTRLMGAFVVWLYLEKGIKNFFVLAPNLTIYNKLIEDFGNPAHPKYVFQGIGALVNNQPRIITGENYLYASQTDAFQDGIHINIFNISKINAETRSGKQPRMKRLSEYIGDSYFNYLAGLPDLVLLMDESHHYRADRGLQVINELKPILGLELTATPQVEKSGGAIKFKNVVYEYSLAKAIRDGFVKEPAVATRRDFNPAQFSNVEMDRIKIEDGIRIHEETKVALDIYARDYMMEPVKPFVLVVAKDTTHAAEIKAMIVSPDFFEGYYMDKVMEIHSNQTGSEKEENIQNLLSLEDPDNKIEIVIHVNMLKEGWDVTNLYTIIPLRAAASQTLREQTIGRGLRLPYGKVTGQPKVDKLTIVAHDRFQEIIDEANKPDSLIRKENIIIIDPTEPNLTKQVIVSKSTIEVGLEQEQGQIAQIGNADEKQKAMNVLEAKKAILQSLPDLSRQVKNAAELTRPEIKEIVMQRVREKFTGYGRQMDMYGPDKIREAAEHYDTFVKYYTDKIIEIPRITVAPSGEIVSGFHDFDLDVKNLNYQPGSEEIIIETLLNNENELINTYQDQIKNKNIENIIVSELINYPEVDYDRYTDLLFKLAGQTLTKFRSYIPEEKIANVVLYHKKDIGKYIYLQLKEHFYYEAPKFAKPVVRPFTKIEEHNLSRYTHEEIYDFRETITPTNSIPSKVFTGFQKACHDRYKFDTKTEKDFAIILEQDVNVLKWLRPATNQFHIYYNHNSQRYKPDFVVETETAIYLIETKREIEIPDEQVQQKAKAALLFCNQATEYTGENGGKPWYYVLIPHNVVQVNMSFEALVKRYMVTEG